MKVEDLKLISYNAAIQIKYIKTGMRILESFGDEERTYIYVVKEVFKSNGEVTFYASTTSILFGKETKITNTWCLKEDDWVAVFFETREKALELGIKEKDIETS